jgi:type I restriction enzyme S subunit
VRNGTIPVIAEGWQWRKFGDCARFINGRAYSQEELLDNGTPVLRIQNLNGGDRWYYSDLTLPGEKYCEDGDLLYAWSASFGPFRFSGPRSIFHYHIWRVIPGEELDKNFAFHLLQEITAEVKSAAHGVAMLHMTKGGIEAWPIPLPPLAEQRRIAEVLDRAEALRTKRRAALAQLDTLTQSIFLDLFGDPTAQTRRFPVQPLEALLEHPLQNGAYFPKESYTEEGGVEMVHMSDAFYEVVPRGRLKRVVCSESDKEKYALSDRDILVARRSLTLEGAAKPCLIPRSNEPLIFESSFIRVSPHPDKITALYLYHYLGNERVKQKCVQPYITQSTISGINQSNLERVPVIVPSVELQYEFARRVAAVEKLKATHRASLAEMDALFASLQHRAFRGEL